MLLTVKFNVLVLTQTTCAYTLKWYTYMRHVENFFRNGEDSAQLLSK